MATEIKSKRKKLTSKTIVALALIALVTLPFTWTIYWNLRLFWQFDHLERNVRKVITAQELQNWAIGLIAKSPTNEMSYRVSDLGTNFPSKLLKLYPSRPSIYVYGVGIEGDVPHVTLFWGSGMMGHTGLEIGPTNFLGMRGTNFWVPGIYSFTMD